MTVIGAAEQQIKSLHSDWSGSKSTEGGEAAAAECRRAEIGGDGGDIC